MGGKLPGGGGLLGDGNLLRRAYQGWQADQGRRASIGGGKLPRRAAGGRQAALGSRAARPLPGG